MHLEKKRDVKVCAGTKCFIFATKKGAVGVIFTFTYYETQYSPQTRYRHHSTIYTLKGVKLVRLGFWHTLLEHQF